MRASKAPTAEQATTALLQEHGYPDDDIAKALAACGPSVDRCIEHCLQLSIAPDELPQADEPVDEQDWAFDIMVDLGFPNAVVAKHMEQCDFDFPLALTSLVYGDREERKLSQHSKRHTSKQTMPAICVSTTERGAVHSQGQQGLANASASSRFGPVCRRYYECMLLALPRCWTDPVQLASWHPPVVAFAKLRRREGVTDSNRRRDHP